MPKPTSIETLQHRQFLRRQSIYERRYRKQFYRWIENYSATVAKWMDSNDSTSPPLEGLVDHSGLERIYKSLYTTLTIDEGELAWEETEGGTKGVGPVEGRKDIIDTLASILGTEGNPINLWRQLLGEWITVRIASRITEVTNTTMRRVAKLIEQAIAEGLGARETARLLRQDQKFNRNRSLAIARTETITAMNQGKYLAAMSSPFVQEKRWIPVDDPRTRESHLDMLDSDWIPLEESFVLINRDGIPEYAQYPCSPGLSAGEAVNCRCASIYRAKKGPNGRLIRKNQNPIKTFLTTVETPEGKFSGPKVYARSWEEAEAYTTANLAYAKIDGEYVKEVAQ